MDSEIRKKAILGCLLGTAVGDALGLPIEGLSPRRAKRLYPDLSGYHFFFNRGMFSDDTEHACFTARAALLAKGDKKEFQGRLAWSMKWWLVGLPAGVGFATLRSLLKLWIGIKNSGVFSAGNGPAMRSPILGVLFGDSTGELKEYVRRSTELTHTDPKAYFGAMAASVAAYLSAYETDVTGTRFLDTLSRNLKDEDAKDFLDLMEQAVLSAEKRESSNTFAATIGCAKGITGYMYHTMPCVIQTWLRHPDDFAAGVREIIYAGGDGDTTAAILGAILGARAGKEGIPDNLLTGIMEWPRSMAWIERLGVALAENGACPKYFAPGLILRNLLFLKTILFHGIRRLAPPY